MAAVLVLLSVGAAGSAVNAEPQTPPVAAKGADPSTYHEYPGAHDVESSFESSRNPGRIWTDKSVFTEDVAVPPDQVQPGVGPLTLGPDELAVALSALGSTRHVTGEEQVPIDVAIVLDNSYSMVQCVSSDASGDGYCDDASNYTRSRAYAMAQAVNEALRIIAGDSPANRVAVAQFGTGAGVLQALGAPRKIPGTDPNDDLYARMRFSGTTNGTLTLDIGNGTLQVGRSGNTVQSTNIQLGIYTGMNVLAGQPAAGVTGSSQRLPSVIVFSDGEPTYSSASASWWAPGTATQGPGSPGNTQYYGNGFLAAMTAAHQKNKIAARYEADPSDGIDARPKVYTVGLGMAALTANGRNLALATLDPKTWYGNTGNTMSTGFTDAFARYLQSATVTVPVNGSATYTVTRPTGTDLAYDPTNLRYNDAYYSPVTQADLISVFRAIAQQIVDAAPNFPVLIEDGTATTSGYVTFTDPLGPFMRVSDMNRITFCSVTEGIDPTKCQQRTFLEPLPQGPVTTPAGTVTTYVFGGTESYTANDMYPQTPVADIIVTVTTSKDLAVGDVVTVKIPASLLPLRNTHIKEDATGKPTSMSMTVSHPVHVYYKVAPKAGVVEHLGDPLTLNVDGSTDGAALAQYLRENTVGGKVRFYSNDFDRAASPGKAKSFASFTPADENDFYRFATNSTLYRDAAGTQTISPAQWAGLAASTPIYYRIDVYRLTGHTPESVVKESVVQPTTKAALEAPAADPGGRALTSIDNAMTAPAGMRNFSGRATNLDHAKCTALTWTSNVPACAEANRTNPTQTDAMARRTEFSGQAVSVALGNDGFLDYQVPGRLTISKEVVSGTGLHPDATQPFEFTVAFGGTAPEGASFPYSVYDVGQSTTPVRSGTVTSGGTITLQAHQVAEVAGLPHGATYTVTEGAMPAGYTQTSPTGNASGTITVPQTDAAVAAFVNTYAPAPAKAVASPTIQKSAPGLPQGVSIDGTFSATICPAAGGACRTALLGLDAKANAFGDFTFATVGAYEFTITEVDGLAPGFTYSGAAYRWVVTVSDDGSGVLKAASTLTRTLTDAGDDVEEPAATAVFVNTYSVGSVGGTLRATKLVEDRTLPMIEGHPQTVPPAKSHAFRYWYVGADSADAPEPPTFGGAGLETVVQSSPGNSNVVSPSLTFTQGHVGQTYYYAVAELPGSYPGITNDPAVFVYRLSVTAPGVGEANTVHVTPTRCATTLDETSGQPRIEACQAFSADLHPTFVNTYAAQPATATLDARKVLTGRPWQPGESFTFTLTPDDEVTRQAIVGGIVTMPEGTESGAKKVLVQSDGPVEFGELTFTQRGTYQFRVVEEVPAPGAPGVSYDQHALLYDVTVDDPELDGVLNATATPREGPQSAVFTNRWSSSLTYDGVDLRKALAGRDVAWGEFEFQVTPADEAAATVAGIPAAGVTVANGDGNPDPALTRILGPIVFGEADLGRSFVYTVREREPVKDGVPQVGGVQYDLTEYTVTITPQYDAQSGLLDVVTVVAGGGTPVTHSVRAGGRPVVTFSNAYAAQPGRAEPRFTKILTGRQWLSGEAFAFELEALTPGAPMPGTTSVVVTEPDDGVAEFGFGAITFPTAGTYQYTVREVIPQDPTPFLTYDLAAAIVTVTVTDDFSGTLKTTVSHDGNEAFSNHYESRYDDLRLEVTKTLTGRDLLPGEFTFEVVPADEDAARLAGLPPEGMVFGLPLGAPEGRPAVLQRVLTEPINQDDAGRQYCYTYSEVVPAEPDPSIVYDDTAYTVCLEVEDDGRGVLTGTTTVTGRVGEEVVSNKVFVNKSDEETSAWPQVPFRNTFLAPSWELTKSSDPASGAQVQPGDEVTYTLTATNTSDVPTAVVATDDVSGVVAHAGLGPLPAGVTRSPDGATLVWDAGVVAPGESVSVSYTATVNDDADGARLRNVVAVASPGGRCVPVEGQDAACTTTHVAPPLPAPPAAPTDPPAKVVTHHVVRWLPRTGSEVAVLGGVALVLVLAGVALRVRRRARR
ncbi:DUF11 domain-containing protein [Xylanimonas allomyrinae]|uniref:DUF11 domain-containing protein n=1 Tax=Xylanimonas allomyrinae TaxID=2509459 RepID=A0A4P6ENL1_9MICO|nr:FctA domain-containing protein [Xylanimonas allomyrinae]QAY64085.1 DUF11 domain-containing protein [Xylanimonas allomyrinae]